MNPSQRASNLGAPYWNEFCVAFHEAAAAAENITQALERLCEHESYFPAAVENSAEPSHDH